MATSPAHADVPAGRVTEEKAVAAARASGEPVEVLSQRGENRTVRALPSGRVEVQEYLRPVRTRQAGGWVDIDTTLGRSGSDVVPAATAVGLRFSGGGDGPMVQMTRAGRKLELSWPETLPEPVLEDDTAVYRGVLGADVDLRLRADKDGFAHTFVVKTVEAAKDPRLAQLAFTMATAGLSVSQDPSSGVLQAKVPASGAEVFEAPSPVMWDSSRPAAPAGSAPVSKASMTDGPAAGAQTAPVQVDLDDGKLTLTPDQGMLTSADTNFPVYIDPVWDTSKVSYWGMVSSGYPDENYPRFNGNATEGMGRCEVAYDSRCVKDQTKRLFFRMPLPSIKGRYIQQVEFVPYETDAYNCDNPTSVQLWRTSALTSSATWNNTKGNWLDHLASRDVAKCSKAPVEFGGTALRDHVASAIGKGYSSITFGLKAYSEESMAWWKRFADDAYLKVQYNNPPYTPNYKSMRTYPGGLCGPGDSPVVINDAPTLSGYFWDPDTEDANKVQPQFAANWDTGDGKGFVQRWTSGLVSPPLTSGTKRTVPILGAATLPQKIVIGWHARAWDGEQYGPWSSTGAAPACYFIYDPSIPAKPTITSTDYPDDDQWHGGIGQVGTFTIADSAKVANRFDVYLNGGFLKSVATTAGAAQTVSVAPDRSGPNSVEVHAFAPSTQNAISAGHEFRVNEGTQAKAQFKLDEAAGVTAAAALTREGEPAISAAVHGGGMFGEAGQIGDGLRLDGAVGSHAATTQPVLDTGKGFAVSVWARLDQADTDRTVLSQDGNVKSGFYLKYAAAAKKWVFAKSKTDSAEGGWYQAVSKETAVLNTWTHLVGVYDETTQKLQLHVNGGPGVQSPAVGPTWNATGGLQIGRSKWLGNPVDHWPGVVDDVRVYDRIIGLREVAALYSEAPVLQARWKLNVDGSGELDRDGQAPALQLNNGAQIVPGTGFRWVSEAGLQLNGNGAFAQTSTAPISTDQSFTLAGWVQNQDRSQSKATVFSLPGANTNAVALRYVPDPVEPTALGGWQLEMNNADLPADDPSKPQRITANFTFNQDDWDHIAVVYNAGERKMSLYVNGSTEGGSDGVSEEGDVAPFAATGGLQVGRNQLGAAGGTEFWPYALDDVWLYQGVLADAQIIKLGQDVEYATAEGP